MNKVVFPVIIASILVAGVFTVAYAQPPFDLSDVKPGRGMVKIIQAGGLRAEVMPLYTTVLNPSLYVTPAGGDFDGVGMLLIKASNGFTYGCSGSLMNGGRYVLTAAHCVTDDSGSKNVVSGTATFRGESGTYTINFDTAGIVVHPSWNGDFVRGNDVALVRLVGEPPSEITRYGIDNNASDDLNNQEEKAGYGIGGYGATGTNAKKYKFGTERDGINLYDDYADTMWTALRYSFVSHSQLQYDFDNGLAKNDAFGFFFSKPQLGLGNDEVNSAPGDSGGPTFTRNGQNLVVTGITSYGVRLNYLNQASSDVDHKLNSSFGEFSGDTSVAFYSSFIDSVIHP